MMGSLRALAIVLTVAPGLVLAQPSASDKQKASDLVKKAIKKSQDGDHETAVELYQQAYKIIPQPLLLSNIGSEFQQMKKTVEARTYFCKYLEADPNGNNVSYATAQAKILYLELSGASSVDDKDVCKPIVKAPPPKQQEPAPTQEPTPIVGPTDNGPKKKPNVLRYVGIGVAVVGAGLFGVGAYYGIQAKSISDEITNHPTGDPWPANIKEREAEGEDAEKKQIGFMVVGGLAVAAGVVMVIVSAPKQEKQDTSVTFTPVATPDTVGFAAAGRF